MGCSVSIFIDDVLNGNVTASNTSFFTGLNTLSAQLNNLNGNLSNINGNMSDLTSTAGTSGSNNAKTYVQTAMDKVRDIPSSSSPY